MFEITIHKDALTEIKAMPEMLRAKLARQIDKLAARGADLREPDTKPLGSGFLSSGRRPMRLGERCMFTRKADVFLS